MLNYLFNGLFIIKLNKVNIYINSYITWFFVYTLLQVYLHNCSECHLKGQKELNFIP